MTEKEQYETRFWADLEDSLTEKVTERNLFATLTSMYGQNEFSTDQIDGNLKETDERLWGTFGSLVSKGVYEEGSEAYSLTEYGEQLAEAVNEEDTIKMSATPEGYRTEGYRAKTLLALEPDEEPEDLGFRTEAISEYETQK